MAILLCGWWVERLPRTAGGHQRTDAGDAHVADPRLPAGEGGLRDHLFEAYDVPYHVTGVRLPLDQVVAGTDEQQHGAALATAVRAEPQQRGALPERLDEQGDGVRVRVERRADRYPGIAGLGHR